MKGTKKRGSEEAKKSKRCLACLLVLLFVIGTLIAPVAAWKGDGGAIEKINAKLEEIDEDPIINSFLYDRMLEYDNPKLKRNEGIEAVKIVVMEGHWWSGYKDVKTFYIVRNDKDEQIDIKGKYKGNDEDLWTFYPNKGQAIDALNILLSRELRVTNVAKMIKLVIFVEKENWPDITEVISKSPWATNNPYIPGWL